MAENNLNEVGRRLRARGGQQANAEELLAELVRLVDFSGLTPERSRPPDGTVSEPTGTDTDPMQHLEMTSLRPSVEAPSSKPGETGAIYVEPPRAPASDNSYSTGTDLATGRRAGTWAFGISALVLVGVAVLGSILWLKRVEPGLPNAPSIAATMRRPTNAAPKQFGRRDFERGRSDAKQRRAAGPGQGRQSRSSADRPERSPLAQSSAAVGFGADSNRSSAADRRCVCPKATCGAGQYAGRRTAGIVGMSLTLAMGRRIRFAPASKATCSVSASG